MAAISLKLSDELAQQSAKTAEKIGISRTELIRIALEHELAAINRRLERQDMAKAFEAMREDLDYERDPVVLPTGETITQGEVILIQFGFVDGDDEPYTFEWAGWGVLFALMFSGLAILASVYFLSTVRFATGQSLITDKGEEGVEEDEGVLKQVEIPFPRVDLTFKDIHYTVQASTSDDKLELLKGIDGVVEAGKMTALMGSSGAGKTSKLSKREGEVVFFVSSQCCGGMGRTAQDDPAHIDPAPACDASHFDSEANSPFLSSSCAALMDVLAMRKSSGVIEGEVTLNGHPQEEKSFRRTMGYVVQFDTQSPQLTIRETCDFSAKLRLDENDSAVTPESVSKFVDQTLDMLELTMIQDLQVGSDEAGGLSFEQRKRLSIAVELVANPSILFLDEVRSLAFMIQSYS